MKQNDSFKIIVQECNDSTSDEKTVMDKFQAVSLYQIKSNPPQNEDETHIITSQKSKLMKLNGNLFWDLKFCWTTIPYNAYFQSNLITTFISLKKVLLHHSVRIHINSFVTLKALNSFVTEIDYDAVVKTGHTIYSVLQVPLLKFQRICCLVLCIQTRTHSWKKEPKSI